MGNKVKYRKTVLDSGPLTIEYIISGRRGPAYRFEARTVKLADLATLVEIRDAIDAEIKRKQR